MILFNVDGIFVLTLNQSLVNAGMKLNGNSRKQFVVQVLSARVSQPVNLDPLVGLGALVGGPTKFSNFVLYHDFIHMFQFKGQP